MNGRTSPKYVLVSNGHDEVQEMGKLENSKTEESIETADKRHEESKKNFADLSFPPLENKGSSGDNDNTLDSGPPPLDDF